VGIVKSAADLAYTFRFIRMLVMKWEEWDAYKQGLIDENGKRIKSVKLDTDAKKSSYTPFVRLAANVKRLLGKVPGGESRLGTFAAALYLIKEQYGVSDSKLAQILSRFEIDTLDFLGESSEWFVLDDKRISPGVYRVRDAKVINSTFEEAVLPKDQIKFFENAYPVGDVFGIDVYEAVHLKTNQKVYVTISELYK
jgi:hypothetical protein